MTERYRLVRGRFARFENGVRRDYKPGDEIELDQRDAKRLVGLVEPVAPKQVTPVRQYRRPASIPQRFGKPETEP